MEYVDEEWVADWHQITALGVQPQDVCLFHRLLARHRGGCDTMRAIRDFLDQLDKLGLLQEQKKR